MRSSTQKSTSALFHHAGTARRRCRHLSLEHLEERTVLSVDLSAGFAGMDFPSANATQSNGSAPPDTIAAAGPNHIVELVNTDIAIYTKAGSKLLQQDLLDFFAPVQPTTFLTDPVVSFDEQLGTSGRFVVGVLEVTDPLFFSDCHLLYAVSDSSDPMEDTNGDGSAFSEMHRFDVETSGGLFGSFLDFPRFGWNADEHVFTGNMFSFNFFTGGFDFTGVQVISIDKSTVADANPNTFAYSRITGGTVHGTLAPATMHGSAPGDPMWMVEEASTDVTNRNQLRVLKFTNLLSGTPTVDQYLVNVAPYTADPVGGTPPATQPGTVNQIQTNDGRILNAEWRNNRLLAAQTVGLSTDAESHARWYELSTAGGTPTLTSQETLDPGAGIYTYFPAVAIAPNGDVGMSYMQSSNTEYMSMYVTARTAAETTMQPAVLAKSGEATYTGLVGAETSPFRAGDFSGIGIDPVDGTFWAANEYAAAYPDPQPAANWATWVAHFSLSGSPPPNQPPIAIAGGPYSGTEDAAVSFNASGSSDPDGDPLTYTWNFGDGTTLTTTSPNPSHTYLWGGVFTVSLSVSDGKGGTDSASTTATVTEVNDAPIANAGGPYSGRKGQAITFNASGSSDFDNSDGTSANNQTLTYTWNFGDGTGPVTTTSPTVAHTYAATGTFTVTLTVSDGLASSTATTTAKISKAGGKPGGGQASSSSVAKFVTLQHDVLPPSVAAQLNQLEQAIAAGTVDPTSSDVAARLNSLTAVRDAFFTLVHSDNHELTQPPELNPTLFQPVDDTLLTELAASLDSPSTRAGKRFAT